MSETATVQEHYIFDSGGKRYNYVATFRSDRLFPSLDRHHTGAPLDGAGHT